MPSQLWVLAGGNGSGKSTFYRQRLEPHGVLFVNADLIARELSPSDPEGASYAAAQLAMARFREHVARGVSFCYETVFSHPSKLDMLRLANDAGYEIVLVYLRLARPELNLARVAQRVTEGGHNVDSTKVAGRLPRTQRHMIQAARLANRVLLFDNSSRETPFDLIADSTGGRIQAHHDPLPGWAVDILVPLE